MLGTGMGPKTAWFGSRLPPRIHRWTFDNRVFGLTKTDQEWSEKLDAALTAARRDNLQQGTNAAYIQGCVCSECRAYQLVRMGRNRC